MLLRATVVVLGIVSLSGCGSAVTEGSTTVGTSSSSEGGDAPSSGGPTTPPTTSDSGATTMGMTGMTGTTSMTDATDATDVTGATDPTDPTDPTSATTDVGTTGDPVMTGTGETTDGTTGVAESTGDESTTGVPVACGEDHVLKRGAADAEVSGDWFTVMSMLGEGMIAKIDPNEGTDGAVVWSVEIPCTATWHVWVRSWDQGDDDSYFVQLDGEPQPAAIFEGDCDQNGNNYVWKRLNWRDPVNARQCQYVEDPWTADWAAGPHEVRFTYRESVNLARIIVTNDAAFVPGPGD